MAYYNRPILTLKNATMCKLNEITLIVTIYFINKMTCNWAGEKKTVKLYYFAFKHDRSSVFAPLQIIVLIVETDAFLIYFLLVLRYYLHVFEMKCGR